MRQLTYKIHYELYKKLKEKRQQTPYSFLIWEKLMKWNDKMTLYKSLDIIHFKDRPRKTYNSSYIKEYRQRHRERNYEKIKAYQKEYRGKRRKSIIKV